MTNEQLYTDIRTDLWNEMSLTQLFNQREIITQKMGMLYPMVESGSVPSARSIYLALGHALDDIDQLLDNKQK